eukprot:6176627-Pleurochrysis_carterae.AAC.2
MERATFLSTFLLFCWSFPECGLPERTSWATWLRRGARMFISDKVEPRAPWKSKATTDLKSRALGNSALNSRPYFDGVPAAQQNNFSFMWDYAEPGNNGQKLTGILAHAYRAAQFALTRDGGRQRREGATARCGHGATEPHTCHPTQLQMYEQKRNDRMHLLVPNL